MTDSFEQISAHNEELARHIVERASARGVTVSTAESLTAGMIASTIADIPGASAVLRGGAVTYCDEIKHRVLGVDQETLDRYTAVSHQTAREMAAGSLELYQSDIAVSATGYAGPGGGTEDDPAGTFYIGWAYRAADGEVPVVDSVRCHYEGDRSCVRAHAVAEALGRIALTNSAFLLVIGLFSPSLLIFGPMWSSIWSVFGRRLVGFWKDCLHMIYLNG